MRRELRITIALAVLALGIAPANAQEPSPRITLIELTPHLSLDRRGAWPHPADGVPQRNFGTAVFRAPPADLPVLSQVNAARITRHAVFVGQQRVTPRKGGKTNGIPRSARRAARGRVTAVQGLQTEYKSCTRSVPCLQSF